MGKSLEEIASRELYQSYAVVVNGEFAYRQNAMLNMFYKGIEYQKEKSIEILSSVLDNWVLTVISILLNITPTFLEIGRASCRERV